MRRRDAASKKQLCWSPQEAFRGAAIAALTERLRASLELANEGGAAELDRLFAEQATLTQREQEVASGVAALQVRGA